MSNQSLSYAMLRELKRLANDSVGNGYYGSCTNSTMNALKIRGLVDIQWTEVPGSIYRNERWVITPAGLSLARPEGGAMGKQVTP
ncbi:hypothetical protein [Pseudomonas chlororaphis]|uniref:hypothetical protein n=1 Tax=Pseudomonas chlororaphis TaxID=587753 RepID=UPI000F56EDE5|nr:hypothetical protein [Pseudomonas chlororaphis]AZC49668.1 hypothetical protein C4K35_2075 [Pseudomonas chlororaphis subsp. piscium]MBP5058521.1 hypothetical protein [Pseudomonas chlororaphis]MBP5139261.1 hypothetical protein [Pseudomonas chlororaphis]QTT98676.1 hypothetical protein HUT26_05190 [Pseudomonas chlororaphis]